MESGRLNTVATIYSRNLLVDQYGSKMITYKKVTTTRCELKHAESKKAAIPNSNGAAENVVVYNNEVQYIYPYTLYFRKYVKLTDYCVVLIEDQFYAVDSVVKTKDYIVSKVHSVDRTLLNIEDDSTDDSESGDGD